MRIISTTPAVHPQRTAAAARTAHVELMGLLIASAVVVLAIWITAWGRLDQLAREGDGAGTVDLRQLRGAEELLPLLSMFEEPFERHAAARALHTRAVARDPALQHVGGLAQVRIPASEVTADSRYVRLRERLARRPAAADVPVLAPADIAAIKPRVTVRSVGEFAAGVRRAAFWFFAAFWAAHLVRRWRRTQDDPIVLPIILLLSGIGLITMLALRDPLRDTLTVSTFSAGVALGLVLLVAASEFDVEASPLRRAMLAPLALALTLAALLLVFGAGPGSSGVKVNLLGVQPVEAIRLLVVIALAAFFARRLDFLRELSEPPTPARPWLRYLRVPRWKDVRAVVIAMGLVLGFFFLQKDLGPALVLSCVFMTLYAIARGRTAGFAAGIVLLAAGFAVAYAIGYPATVRQRVTIWADPWNNGVPGGNQIAHGLWALSSGGLWGGGPGLGSPQSIPAGHTDFVLAAVGEELGFIGFLIVIVLYAMLCWRCLRTAARAPGDFTAFLAIGIALALVVQALVIASGILGLFPLSGVVTPFLSSGRSSMLANCLAVGVVLGIAKRQGAIRPHLHAPIKVLGAALALVAVAIAARAAWVQVVKADEFATAASLTEQADGGIRFEYNPRLVSAARELTRGTIYDRHDLPLATSTPLQMAAIADVYRKAGITAGAGCPDMERRCYPLGGPAFSLVGDWNDQTNWGARNSSYFERDNDVRLKGYDDRQRVVEVVNRRTGAREWTIRRDYRELLPLLRYRHDPSHPAVAALTRRSRSLATTIDARLQVRAAAALRRRATRAGHARGAVVVIDVTTGDLLASVSSPWPEPATGEAAAPPDPEGDDPFLDRARYGLYPPGSTFKLLTAAAALRSSRDLDSRTFTCVRLPGGRVGNFVRGWSRPVRDDVLDTSAHGAVDLRRGLVVSCNAYFAQLALTLGPRPIVDAAAPFQIEVARPATAAALRDTLPHSAYGQGNVLVSPLKMARVAAAIAARGVVVPVKWIRSTEATGARQERFVSESDAALLGRYMREVVTSGTGRALQSNATAIAGKTGTAEVDGRPSHSWFVGFAPYGGPARIAFAVVVENAGYGSHAAAPIAGDVVTAARELGLFK